MSRRDAVPSVGPALESLASGVARANLKLTLPDVFTTSGRHPQYYIRPWIDTFDQQGQPTKVQKRIYLGRTSEMSKGML
jgi:hypothetical protein